MVWHHSAEDRSVNRNGGIRGQQWEVYFHFKLRQSCAEGTERRPEGLPGVTALGEGVPDPGRTTLSGEKLLGSLNRFQIPERSACPDKHLMHEVRAIDGRDTDDRSWGIWSGQAVGVSLCEYIWGGALPSPQFVSLLHPLLVTWEDGTLLSPEAAVGGRRQERSWQVLVPVRVPQSRAGPSGELWGTGWVPRSPDLRGERFPPHAPFLWPVDQVGVAKILGFGLCRCCIIAGRSSCHPGSLTPVHHAANLFLRSSIMLQILIFSPFVP